MVQLRKRKTPPPSTAPAPKKSTASKVASLLKGKKKESTAPAAADADAKPSIATATVGSSSAAPVVGEKIDLTNFGGTVQLNDGTETTLSKLIDESTSGVVVFTYPKANTPGCTKQACLFRDANTTVQTAGYNIYGLSLDSPKANSSFQTKYTLPYSLICDVKGTLIKDLGFKKAPSGTQRGVAVIGKDGKVLVWMAGGPDATLEAVLPLIKDGSAAAKAEEKKEE